VPFQFISRNKVSYFWEFGIQKVVCKSCPGSKNEQLEFWNTLQEVKRHRGDETKGEQTIGNSWEAV
jgi:hypothetical protein